MSAAGSLLPPAILLLASIAAPLSETSAQCIPVPPPPPHRHLPVEVVLESVDVDVQILDGVATTRLRETVRNPGGFELQARFVLPVPRGAVVRGATLAVGDRWIEAEVLEAHEARRAYEEIVREAHDPALVEYAGEGLLRTHVFPIPAGATREIELTLTAALPEVFGRWHLRLPLQVLGTGKAALDVEGRARSSHRPLAEPFSPTHDLRVQRHGAREWSFRTVGESFHRDLQVFLPVEGRELTALLTSIRAAGQEGTLLLRLSPGYALESLPRMPRDLVLVLDTSGSMAGEKIRQAKAALRVCLESLGAKDCVGLITYEADVRTLTDGLTRSDERKRLLDAIDHIEARGGTNLGDALATGLAMLDGDSHRPAYVVLLTDGLPTVGVKDTERLREIARESNHRDARLFTFGVGTDVDARLLDALATDHRATSRYVLPGEDLEIALGDFALQISEPVWSELELRWEGADVTQTVPARLPDLFRGQTLTVLARYPHGGPVTLLARGRQRGEPVERRFRLELADGSNEHGYLPSLWAGRRVAWLERELRVRPDDHELRAEIRRLGETFGLITSQTSLLAREPRFAGTGPPVPRLDVGYDPRPLGHGWFGSSDGATKAEVWAAARQSRSIEAISIAGLDAADRLAPSFESSAAVEERRIDARRLRTDAEQRWIEVGLEDATADLVVRAFSEAWFELARLRPDLARVLAASTRLRVRVGDEVLEVDPDQGIETWNVSPLSWLRRRH